MCALELWQEDATGGFVPANPPDDPQLSDFLASGQRLAADVSPAFMFCLEDDGLDVRPLFWGLRASSTCRGQVRALYLEVGGV